MSDFSGPKSFEEWVEVYERRAELVALIDAAESPGNLEVIVW